MSFAVPKRKIRLYLPLLIKNKLEIAIFYSRKFTSVFTAVKIVVVYRRSIENQRNSLTHSWSRALLEKLPIVQLLKNFSAFYGTRRFITAFT
jgi:hypothetical protein